MYMWQFKQTSSVDTAVPSATRN